MPVPAESSGAGHVIRMERSEPESEIYDACVRAKTVFYRYGIPDEDIEDLVHEVFLAAYTGVDKLRDRSRLYAWVRGISRNKARKYWRAETLRRRDISLDSEEGMAAFVMADRRRAGRDIQYETIKARETLERICRTLAAMKEKELRIILLYAFRGYSLREISETEGMNYATVRTIYSRAKKKLRAITEDRSG